METLDKRQIEAAEVVFPCENLAENLVFFTETLGFRLQVVYPADAPRVAVVSGYGVCIRLEEKPGEAPALLRLLGRGADISSGLAEDLMAPNGTRIEFGITDAYPHMPDLRPSLSVQKAEHQSNWGDGRAGMQYRDLIPDRWGGAYIASHIRIPEGGPVADYVHHHHINFQLIYCYKGWVRVVYEDQGPEFVMEAGDCVLQPPHIRHRVLECSAGLEVIEIGCPAEHETLVDHELILPTEQRRPERDFGGQRFCFHQAASADWSPWRCEGFENRDTGIASATDNAVSVSVVRPTTASSSTRSPHRGGLLFKFVLQGSMTLECNENERSHLVAGDACAIPAGIDYCLSDCSDDLEFLEVLTPPRM